jgi:hypothetical protein
MFNDLKLPANPGDALVNGSSSFPDLEALQADFDILYFLDFCFGLESAVMHNTLFTVGSLTSSKKNSAEKILLEEKVLRLYQLSTPDTAAASSDIVAHPRFKSLLAAMPSSFSVDKSEIYTALYATATTMGMDVVLEDELDIPLVLSAHETPVYLMLPDIRREQNASLILHKSLSERYEDFRQTLMAIRSELDGPDAIRIPPVALQILAKADKQEEIGSVLMEIRKRYASVRSQFAELDEILRSDDKSPKSKLKAKMKIARSVNSLFSSTELDKISVLTTFGKRLNDTTKIAGVSDGLDPGDINYTKIVGYLIEKAEASYWKFRLRPLHATKKAYMDITSREITAVIKKHFGHEVTQRDAAIVKNYFQEVESIRAKLDESTETA